MSLKHADSSIKLSSKVFELLMLFIDSPDNVVSRQQAIDTIWLGNEGVGKKGFTNGIWVLRKTFKDLGIEEEVFNTLPKLGYQLTLTVQPIDSQTTPSPTRSYTRYFRHAAFVTISLVAALLLWLGLSDISDQQPVQIGQLRPVTNPTKLKVTNYGGVEEHIAVSHDGQRLAMQWRDNSLSGKIYIKELSQVDAPLTLISFENNEEASPAWSRSDEKLAYVRLDPAGGCQVRVRNLLDNTDQLIASDCFYIPYKRIVSWSGVDDKRLLYAKKMQDRVALMAYHFDTAEHQQVSFPDKNEIDYAPKWLDQDTQLAFIRERAASNLLSLILQTGDGSERELIQNSPSIVDFDYSAREQLFYVNNLDGAAAIISRIHKDGSQLAPLAQSGLPSSISLSDTNAMLYVTEHISKEYITQQAYGDGKQLRRISSSSRDMYGKYAKATGDILFLSNRSALWSIWRNNKVSSKNITHSLGNVGVPAISPVSSDFAVNIITDTGRTLYIGNIESENFRAIDIQGIEADNLSWSADGEALYFKGFAKEKNGIYKLNVKSGELEKITQQQGVYAIEGQDANHLYLSKFDQNGIWHLDRTTNQMTLITDKLAKYDYGAFYYEQGYLYFLSRDAEHDAIMRISLADKDHKPELVQSFAPDAVRKFFGLSPADGHSFLVTLKLANEADVFGYKLVTE
ncbi:winged helix-turn-helix domain-containing protein [Shewanella sp. KCT]|uniref:winged helix-turn-helix domain-containing protein n=1 Tax=Shewanella sp. KCT TaxID=2569535 RepID=UPI0016431230|nr:winged helix-turn-helix domain-containing protein [Shewanella sp. KCT]